MTDERVSSIITRNNSPDIPFTQSINPYAGCEHGCIYCVDGDTPILMADGRTRRLADIRAGDEIYGTVRDGRYRRYIRTRVLAHWSVIKPAYRVTLEDGTSLVAGRDHRFLTERGWKFVTGAMSSVDQRRTSLPATSSWAPALLHACCKGSRLLPGISLRDDTGRRPSRDLPIPAARSNAWRPVPVPAGPLRHGGAAKNAGVSPRLRDCDAEFVFQKAVARRQMMHAIRTHARSSVEQIGFLIAWPSAPTSTWMAGFLAGIFDAEGSCSQGVLRISNTDQELVGWIRRCLESLNFAYAQE